MLSSFHDETVSHLLNACKKGKAFDFLGPRDNAISWAGRYLKLLPVAKATHSSSMWASLTAAIANINTSESAVRIITLP